MLPRVGWWGDARLRVAQFLANIWQGPARQPMAMDAGAIVRSPATSDWHLSCVAVLRRPGSRVLRKVMRQWRVSQSWARSGDMTADVAYGTA
jgi:hypothetical protein